MTARGHHFQKHWCFEGCYLSMGNEISPNILKPSAIYHHKKKRVTLLNVYVIICWIPTQYRTLLLGTAV